MVVNCVSNMFVELCVVENFNFLLMFFVMCCDEDLLIDFDVVYENGDESEIVFMRVCVCVLILLFIGVELLGLG